MSVPHDYLERTYGGVLGKIIGVYLGRPFEGWTYERIMAELGEITGYVHERRRVPLIVTDDDIAGTFTFLRALSDYGTPRDLTPQQIGQTWLNYIIEKRTILWWGGMGHSTEHTAYLRLKHGIPAPVSGSIACNTKTVAEQIGAQIFIDGWAMVAPGDPDFAADLARRAASVSHDGEAVYGAQVIAVMEALAYVENDLNVLLDTAVKYIPAESIIRRLIDDVRDWHGQYRDWRDARLKIFENYGYDKYGGNCHIVPNHALIHLALLYGDSDFGKSLMIVNTSGWDTDCNSGNVGCLLGIKNGLAGIDGSVDWRGPVADRLYLPTADGGSAISDAAIEAVKIVNLGRLLAGEAPIAPKNGARFHFELRGSMQGFTSKGDDRLTLANVAGQSEAGSRSLAIGYRGLRSTEPATVTTPTFIPPEAIRMLHYELIAAPTLYSGQTVRAGVKAAPANAEAVTCGLIVQVYGADDQLEMRRGEAHVLTPGASARMEWTLPDTGGKPIAMVGLEITAADAEADGTIYLEDLTWTGEPRVTFVRPQTGGTMWQRAWVTGVDLFDLHGPEAYRIIQNEGTGLLMTGTREWSNYSVTAALRPQLIDNGGIAARVQGLRRYYALILAPDGKARLIKALDGVTVLAEISYDWQPETEYLLRLDVRGTHLTGWINGQRLLQAEDHGMPLSSGGIGLLVREGCIVAARVSVSPL
jgi:ADP-ribosylglycohydrolase